MPWPVKPTAPVVCGEPGCHRPVRNVYRQLCNVHYHRLQKAGPLPPVDVFTPQVDKGDGSGCWIWTGPKNHRGYGRYGRRMAHRYAWEQQHGPIPGKLTVDHKCRNIVCVRPDHLRLMSRAANSSLNSFQIRTHCSRGHEYTPENTKVRVRGNWTCRVCRTCLREDGRARVVRKRAAKAEAPRSGR
jgi:hypothetical protein